MIQIKWLRKGIAWLFSFFIFITLVLVIIVTTPLGRHLLVYVVETTVPEISIASSNGILINKITLDKASYDKNNIKLKFNTIDLKLNWKDIFQGNFAYEAVVDITDIIIQNHNIGTARLQTNGNLKHLQINNLTIQTLPGNIDISGNIHWDDKLQITLNINPQSININKIYPEIQSNINAKINWQTNMQPEGMHHVMSIESLSGHIQENSISGSGQVELKKKTIKFNKLQLSSGKNNIHLNGQIAKKWDLNWDINAENLQTILPFLHGSITGKGGIRGDFFQPIIDTTLTAENIKYKNYSLAKALIKAKIDYLQDIIQIQSKATNINLNNTKIEFFKTTANGSLTNHTVNILLKEKEGSLVAKINGSIEQGFYNGIISKLNILTENYQHWQLIKPGKIKLNKEHIEIDNLCIEDSSNNSANSCIEFSLNKNLPAHQIHLNLTGNNLPAQYLIQYFKKPLELSSNIDFNINYNKNGKNEDANFKFLLSPGKIDYKTSSEGEKQLEYKSGEISGSLKNKVMATTFIVDFINQDKISGNWSIKDIDSLTTINKSNPIAAQALIKFTQLDIIEALTASKETISGEIIANVVITGTLGSPIVKGSANLQNGDIGIPELGITLKNVKLDVEYIAQSSATISGSANSGKGKIDINGSIQWLPTIEIDLNLVGKEITFADIPEALIIASPNISIKYKPKDIQVTGDIHLNKARLAPIDFQLLTKLSEDTVIIDRKKATVKKTISTKIKTDLTMTLGDDIEFHGFNLNLKLGGKIRVIRENHLTERAQGELKITSGDYTVYGQNLTISRGRVIYTGGPLTNPGLDIRAQRKIRLTQKQVGALKLSESQVEDAASSDIVDGVVGVEVKGTLERPILSLFSEPALPETDRFSYLVLGVPATGTSESQNDLLAGAVQSLAGSLDLFKKGGFIKDLTKATGLDQLAFESTSYIEDASGSQKSQTSLVLGKTFSPELSLSYSVGLIDPISIIRLRYKLSRRWALQSETSTQGQGGGDIIYTIDTDL